MTKEFFLQFNLIYTCTSVLYIIVRHRVYTLTTTTQLTTTSHVRLSNRPITLAVSVVLQAMNLSVKNRDQRSERNQRHRVLR